VQARISRLVYGADDSKAGAVRSVFAIANHAQLNHRVDVVTGVLRDECAGLLQAFFSARR